MYPRVAALGFGVLLGTSGDYIGPWVILGKPGRGYHLRGTGTLDSFHPMLALKAYPHPLEAHPMAGDRTPGGSFPAS